MKKIYFLSSLLLLFIIVNAGALQVEVKNDNGTAAGNMWIQGRDDNGTMEESVRLIPDGPCKINKIRIYFSGTKKTSDTLYICGNPTINWDQGWRPTSWVWGYNTVIDPIIYNYDGTAGWKDIDVSQTDLRSDGFDNIIIQHHLRADGPWFTYDNSGNGGSLSWINNPWATTNPGEDYWNYFIPGNFMARLVVEYTYPDGNSSQPPLPPSFVDVTDQVGINVPATDVAAVDWNNDGLDDLAMYSYFFQNNGDGTFTNATAQIGITGGSTMWGDINNDGKLDVYVKRLGPQDFNNAMVVNRDAVYLNVNGKYVEQPAKAVFNTPFPSPNQDMFSKPGVQDSMPNPYYTCTPMWLDYDGDGWLDLFIANRRSEGGGAEIYFPDELWKGDGKGKLTNVRASANINGEPFVPYSPSAFGWGYYDCYGAAACDYNQDGKTDIFVANYRLAPDNLYKNLGNGTFTDVGPSTGVQGEPTLVPYYFGHGMGCEWGDFNNDGLPDLCVGNLGHPNMQGAYSNPSLIYQNQGPPNYNFVNVRKKMGLKFHEGNGGVVWLDMDNDGLLDLWHGKYDGGKGSFYLNQGPPDYKLKEITWNLNCLVQAPWSAIRTDYDMDGDLDLVIKGRLYRNDLPHKGNFISIRLSGSVADNVNMDAYGTKVLVYSGNKKFYRDLMGSASGTHTNQNTSELHFGLGKVDKLDSVVISYPNGKSKSYTTLKVNNHYIIPYMGTEKRNGLTTPALTSPINFAVKIPKPVTLEWSACGEGVEYNIIISDSINFSNVIYSGKLQQTSTVQNVFTDNKTYYWKVQTIEGTAKSQWSSVWNFTIGLPKPNVPVLISPVKDSANVTLKPELNWNAATYNNVFVSKTLYQLQLSTQQDFSTLELDTTNLNSLKVAFNLPLKPATKYFWHVRGINETVFGDWSATWNFTTIGAPVKGSLVSPLNGDTSVVIRPLFNWDVIPLTKLYDLQVSKDSTFKTVNSAKTVAANSYKHLQALDKGTIYYWHIRGNNEAGAGVWTDTWSFKTEGIQSVEEIPADRLNPEITLEAVPNPFANSAVINFSIPKSDNIGLTVYNSAGVEIVRLYSGFLHQGSYKTEWQPEKIEPGAYFIKLNAGSSIITSKIIYMP